MGREKGRMGRALTRLFRERQIYHRSDGVVRFVKLSTRTQLALATVMGASLIWVAYASVNAVFKEQIIVSKDQERRDQEAAYRRRLQVAETAYAQVSEMNVRYAREFEATISIIEEQHRELSARVESKLSLDQRIEALAQSLSATGAPGGRRPESSNRLMVDPVGREPTPRQSRTSALRNDTLHGIMDAQVAEILEDSLLNNMWQETAELSVQQVLLMAQLEENMRLNVREMDHILDHTGVDLSTLIERHRTAGTSTASFDEAAFTGQGGPLIDAGPEGAAYFRSAARIEGILGEMEVLYTVMENIPLAQPIEAPHRMSSRFGWRWDPIRRNRRARHLGLDFAGPRNTPILATAPGRVSFAGARSGFGNTVEIDHGNGFKTRFAHLNRIRVRAGQQVDAQDEIGLMGNTGRSTGTHLHYEIHYRGRQVDPLKFIEAGRYVFES